MKPYATYGKKPRGSKTSKRDTINGIPVFLHSSSADTGGGVVAYWDRVPYPRIIASAGSTYWIARDKVEEFFSKNALEIDEALKTLDKNFGIPKEFFDKKFKTYDYEIYEGNPWKEKYRLVTPYYNGEYLYLWIIPDLAPYRNVNNKKIPDVNAILEEYLKRKKDD
jgi:hypothetical protein